MPPKGGDKAKKAAEKAKAAAKKQGVEDKTFGLKNKNKSSKVQKYVETMEKGAMAVSAKQARLAEPSRKDKQKAEEERQKELNALFAVAIKQPKVPVGVDPKSILCEFFRHNQCTKGKNCKFSHDLDIERKVAKIDLYSDRRNGAEEDEGMEDWDQETLEKVVREKHGGEKPTNKTDIVCKFFLEAVEKRQYGWFWKCPNGGECKYRHALPPGYVLRSQMKELLEEEARNAKDVAEVIEEERSKVEAKTKITEQVFRDWHNKRVADKKRKADDAELERRKKGYLNGREIFMQEGFEAVDDASAADDYVRGDDEEVQIRAMMAKAEAERLASIQERAAEEAAEAAAAAAAAAAATTAVASEAGPSTAGATPSGDGGNGPSTSGAAASTSAGPSSAAGRPSAADEEALFGDDDDDDDEEAGEDEVVADDYGEEDDDLEALEAAVRSSHIAK